MLPIIYYAFILIDNPLFGGFTLIISIIVSLIKIIVASQQYPFTLRPKNAANCNILLNNGHQGLKPGFPSGHMTFATLFALYLYNKTNHIWHIHLIPLMAYARFALECHNIPQIIGGIIFGALAFYFYQYYILII
jgi:membrane-associated phospholipid phosphatase